jgi:predicted AAA+ superfamily ATPase
LQSAEPRGDDQPIPKTDFYPRFAADRLTEALHDSPAVLSQGPRQSGKTTLARRVAARAGYAYLSFDDEAIRSVATTDPVGFVADLPPRVILDEVQHVPQLFVTLKAAIDRDRRPGRFVLTGSTNVLLLPKLSDSLAGRMAIVRLHPLAQCEIERTRPSFLERLFDAGFKMRPFERLGAALADRALQGQLLETFVFQELKRQASWHERALAFHHFRDRDGYEVDIVLEQGAHAVAGIEVKAAATVTAADFRGLRKLKDAAGRRFACGVVLYDGAMSLRFGEGFFALPIRALWEAP